MARCAVIASALLLAVLGVFRWASFGADTPPWPGEVPPISPPEETCGAGCSADVHVTPALSRARYETLLAEMVRGPMSRDNAALEELLFYGADVRRWLADAPPERLAPDWRELLERESARRFAVIDMRFVNREGIERIRLEPTRVPLGIKQHVHPTHRLDLPPLELSGTVKRVGLDHLWTRI
ncbi:MAG: hypothetical protein ACYTGP_06585 [Planctomycetota bacterium]|jgi:hypothetical protein